ncbi:MAG: hypothetical protein H7245_14555 [Candidatus Saccharibacteria bacterium]|nr:hypothetical protein [Pseudorhodobacter sp.]
MTESVGAYLIAIPPDDQRQALQALRATLRAVLRERIETNSYAMPGLRQPGPRGKMVAGHAAFARNRGFYPCSGTVIPQFAAALAGWKITMGAIQFTPGHPLPPDLIRRLVHARQAQLA